MNDYILTIAVILVTVALLASLTINHRLRKRSKGLAEAYFDARKRYIVVAGDRREASDWMRQHRAGQDVPNAYTAVTRPEEMRGLQCHIVIWLPGWHRNLTQDQQREMRRNAALAERL